MQWPAIFPVCVAYPCAHVDTFSPSYIENFLFGEVSCVKKDNCLMAIHIHILYMVPEEPGGVHAQEAAGHHQKGGESYKVVVRERYIQWALFRDKKLYQWRDSLT
jgi:hypothetical protein